VYCSSGRHSYEDMQLESSLFWTDAQQFFFFFASTVGLWCVCTRTAQLRQSRRAQSACFLHLILRQRGLAARFGCSPLLPCFPPPEKSGKKDVRCVCRWGRRSACLQNVPPRCRSALVILIGSPRELPLDPEAKMCAGRSRGARASSTTRK